MNKIWYIFVNGKEEGPFTDVELSRHPSFNPDTLVRREGSSSLIPARKIPELRHLFEDKKPKEEAPSPKIILEDGDSLAISADPPFFSFWLMLVIGILLILFYLLSQNL